MVSPIFAPQNVFSVPPKTAVTMKNWEILQGIKPFNNPDSDYLNDFKQLTMGIASCNSRLKEYQFILASCQMKAKPSEICPLYDSRYVVFPQDWDRYTGDFYSYYDTAINSSYQVSGSNVQFPNMEPIYMGQAPHSKYFTNFFKFLYSSKVTDLVAIGPVIEHWETKMDSYFDFDNAPVEGKQYTYPQLGYEKISTVSSSDSTYWRMDLKSLQDPKKDLHIHRFLSWQDIIPTSPSQLFELVKNVYESHSDKTKPIFVHCSAGIGRSAVFALAYYFYANYVEKKEPVFSVAESLLYLRTQRKGVVKSFQEYELLCNTVEHMRKTLT